MKNCSASFTGAVRTAVPDIFVGDTNGGSDLGSMTCPDDQFASGVSLYYDTIQYTVVSTALLCSGIAASSGRDPTGANSSILSNVATIPANELNVADQIAMGLGNGPAYPTGACAPGTSSLYNFACASSWGWGVCSEAFTAQCPPGYLLQGLTGVSAGGTTCFANVNVICVQLSTTGAPGNGTISMATPQTSYNGTAQSSVCPGSSTVQSFGARGGCCQDSLKPQCAVPMVNCSGTPRSGGPFKLVTLACTMGSSCPANTTEPVPCPGGSFSNVTGATACTTCPPGKFAPARSTGQTACLVCAAGLNSTAGATVCTTRTPIAAPPSPPTAPTPDKSLSPGAVAGIAVASVVVAAACACNCLNSKTGGTGSGGADAISAATPATSGAAKPAVDLEQVPIELGDVCVTEV